MLWLTFSTVHSTCFKTNSRYSDGKFCFCLIVLDKTGHLSGRGVHTSCRSRYHVSDHLLLVIFKNNWATKRSWGGGFWNIHNWLCPYLDSILFFIKRFKLVLNSSQSSFYFFISNSIIRIQFKLPIVRTNWIKFYAKDFWHIFMILVEYLNTWCQRLGPN